MTELTASDWLRCIQSELEDVEDRAADLATAVRDWLDKMPTMPGCIADRCPVLGRWINVKDAVGELGTLADECLVEIGVGAYDDWCGDPTIINPDNADAGNGLDEVTCAGLRHPNFKAVWAYRLWVNDAPFDHEPTYAKGLSYLAGGEYLSLVIPPRP